MLKRAGLGANRKFTGVPLLNATGSSGGRPIENRLPARGMAALLGRSLARFVNQWTSETLHPEIARAIISDLAKILHPQEMDYFRTTREAAFGTTFENLATARVANIETLQRVLQPLNSTLGQQVFLAGDTPSYADHVAFGAFQWAQVSSPISLIPSNSSITIWRERMLDAYDGLARATPAA